ncbi:hypothetical protein IFM89_001622 [Coptis chinensis]|uniref:Uncharacterized protein n=1 Tax=Coptis chinensis TaxID=261450 RepID=A0A835HIJ8_9MAGN|nr:hypothetical protein IFM89_001622 [Coptis chinensis]
MTTLHNNDLQYPSPPPPSSSGGHTTVVVVVIISLGVLFCLAFLSFALCCFITHMKKKYHKHGMKVDEHLKVQEAVVPGQHGTRAVALTAEEDIDFQEESKKNEMAREGTHAKPADIEEGLQAKGKDTVASSTGAGHHLTENKH